MDLNYFSTGVTELKSYVMLKTSKRDIPSYYLHTCVHTYLPSLAIWTVGVDMGSK